MYPSMSVDTPHISVRHRIKRRSFRRSTKKAPSEWLALAFFKGRRGVARKLSRGRYTIKADRTKKNVGREKLPNVWHEVYKNRANARHGGWWWCVDRRWRVHKSILTLTITDLQSAPSSVLSSEVNPGTVSFDRFPSSMKISNWNGHAWRRI